MTSLKENNIILRALEPADLELLYRWENNPEIWPVSNTLVPFSRHVLQQYLEHSHQDIYQMKQLRLMIDIMEGEMAVTVGAVDLFDFDPLNLRAGVGILIADKENRGKGIARHTLKILMNYARQTLMLHQLYCNISVTNKVSINLFSSLGFTEIGIKREWIRKPGKFEDEIMMQLLLSK